MKKLILSLAAAVLLAAPSRADEGMWLLPLLEKYRGRHYSVHLKENVPSATATLGERPKDGSPLVPWNEVFACLAAEDVAWYVVEAEAVPDSLEPLRDSRRFLREWI